MIRRVAEIGTARDLDRQLAVSVAATVARGVFPLTLAGNCISSVGTLGGLGAGPTGVLWFDAHGDFNTPESTVGGFLDGMALATVTGRCWTGLAATHVDLDVLDAWEGRANGSEGGAGITLAGLLAAIEAAGARCPVAAGAITAYDPAYDRDGRVCMAATQVALALAAAGRG